jgi:spermidine synthase
VSREQTSRAPIPVGALLLVASGAAALAYQVVWIKQLALILGVDLHAVATGVAAFFTGLAAGSWVFGRLADRAPRPMRLYAWLEAGVAILGVSTTIALSMAAQLVVRLEAVVGVAAWTLPLLLVAAPALLMGGTLPAMIRAVSGHAAAARAGGWLYAANTAGAVAGALLPPFVLIPAFGVRGAAFAAAVANLVAMVGALAADRLTSSLPGDHRPNDAIAATGGDGSDTRAATRYYALAGAVALGYEVVWSQIIVQFTSTRVFAFAVVLATYLAGLALGSALYARLAPVRTNRWASFGWLIGLAGCLSLATVSMLGDWVVWLQSAVEWHVLAWTSSPLAGMCARFAVVAALVVFLPTLLLGAAFPAAVAIASSDHQHRGRDIGRLLALNTLGGSVGSLAAGFLLVPALGLVRTLAVLAVSATLIGVAAARRGRRDTSATSRVGVAAVAAITLLTAIATPPDHIARLLLAARGGGTLVFYGESAAGTVGVVQQPATATPFRRLYIQGVSNSGDSLPSLRYMRLQALLPLLIHPGEPRSALVIGLGTGITAGALLSVPTLETRVVAELMPAVVEAVPLFQGNYGAPAGLDLRVRDGRRELLAHDARYDLITLEPPPPSAAGVVNLYSRDFYTLARRRLAACGVVAQWWPLPTQNDEDSRALVRAFLEVFPHASVWTTELHEMLLLGSECEMRIDLARIARRFVTPSVRQALSEAGLSSPEAVLATWIGGRDVLERYAGDAEAVTDDRPSIEHAGWVRLGEVTRVLPHLMSLSTPVPVEGADAASVARIAAERARLHTFYRAAMAAYTGEDGQAARQMRGVLAEDPANPYYLWFRSPRPD